MGKLIKTVTIDNDTQDIVEEVTDVIELSEMPWRKYLKMKNYNKDRYKMCEVCIAEQKRKYKGETPIICNGLRDYKTSLKVKFDENIIDSIVAELSEEEFDELQALFNPFDWFRVHMTDKSKAQDRWAQELALSCSAKNKAIRWGRRCGKSYAIIMELMYKIALAEKPLSILVAAPMVTMIDEISQVFVELSNLIDIPGFIQSKKSSPILEITFFNGSILKGITAADDGKSARGKKADVIWIDEVDFVPTKALDAIRAIQLDNPNVELIYTSTPIGEGNLFNFANQRITKEFHYPTFTRPDYTDEMHSSTEALSAIAYAQEILAIYGLDEAGVFPIRFIDMAYDYYIKDSYNEDFVLNNRDRFILIIGVDWNHDNNGTRIVVLGHDRVYSKFFIVEKQRISKIKMTQTLAVQTIVDLNRKYNCDHIICDEGFGIAQVSMLRLKGEEQYGKVPPNHPDIKLVDTVAVSFGSTLEITDPVKHQTIKKNTKQYIVENAQKVLENNQLALDDLKDDEVILQMKNYHIARTGLRGNIYKPKDKKIGDHDLDALMLALYGFDMFYGAFIKPTLVEHGNILSKDVNYAAAGRTFGSEEYGSTLNTNLKFSRNNKRKSFKPRKRW